MKQTILTFLFLGLLGAAIGENHGKEVSEHDQQVITFYLTSIRGLWEGYYDEFFHFRKEMDQRCFSNESTDEVYQVLYFLKYLEFSELIPTADALVSFFRDNLVYCGYNETVSAIQQLCISDKEACSPYSMLHNIEENFFKLIDFASSIANLVMKREEEKGEVYEVMYQIGSDIAKLLVMIFNI